MTYVRIGEELGALAAAHPHNYTALYSDALEFSIVVDKKGHVQSAERCAQLMNDADALRILLKRRAEDVAALTEERAAMLIRLAEYRSVNALVTATLERYAARFGPLSE